MNYEYLIPLKYDPFSPRLLISCLFQPTVKMLKIIVENFKKGKEFPFTGWITLTLYNCWGEAIWPKYRLPWVS